MTRITVSEHILRWVVDRSGNPEAIEQKFPKLRDWMSGESRPTLRQVEQLSRTTATPLGYFFLQEPSVERLPIPHFRTLQDNHIDGPSPNLLETVQIMERRQAWMSEYLIELGQEPLKFVKSANIATATEEVASEIRHTLGLVEGWSAQQPTWSAALRNLQIRIEEVGILVAVNSVVGNNTHRKLDVDEFRGFVLVDDYAPLIFVNGADAKAAQMFTLAHEVAHVWFGSSAAFDLRELQPSEDSVELACNRVAAEFLVPASEIRNIWPEFEWGFDQFRLVARQFKVSELVAARRAQDLNLITKSEFISFYKQYRESDRIIASSQTQRGGGNFYLTQNLRLGRRFAETVVRAVGERKLFYKEAYRLTGLYGKMFDTYASMILSGA